MSKPIAVIAISGIAALLVSELPKQPLIVWNASSSVPIGFYKIERRQPRRGDLALVKLPSKIADWAVARGYLPSSAYLLKPVAAIGGDRVCRIGRAILVQGRIVGTAANTDAAGRAMPRWHGCRALKSGELFVLSATSSSFDSRYFGPVRGRHVLGAASTIWTY
jgi:conjugative transfer signal peptidase TraF